MSVQLIVFPIVMIQMFMLSCMIGPPGGLNLRNILWHGFASPSEISQELVMLDSTMHELIFITYPFTLGMHISSLLLFQLLERCSSLSLLHHPSISITDHSSLSPKNHNLPISSLVNINFIMPILYVVMYSLLSLSIINFYIRTCRAW